jgi:hypothetical protein
MSSPSKTSFSNSTNPEPHSETVDFSEQVRVNQKKLATELKPHYDFIVCGSGSSGSVVARTCDITTTPGKATVSHCRPSSPSSD